jgi:hypothetical protein
MLRSERQSLWKIKAVRPEWHLLKESMIILYRHSRMFVAGINSFKGWIPAKNSPE